ncbi:hypothetical protein ACFJIW_14800 [Tahibacter sp. UC22_41]|uniref:hypothetical protein n=1 Tax=Tahibacter sp. UC22_41 TaxID=3350178 RepID=UPI0036D76724
MVAVTATVTLHEEWLFGPPGAAASDPPLSCTLPAPAAAVTDPPQVLVMFGVAATVRPDGNVSVRPIGEFALVV